MTITPDSDLLARPGSFRAATHGANSEFLLSTKAAMVCEALIGVYPWVLDSDVVAIEQYCRAEARARMLSDHFMQKADTEGIDAVSTFQWELLNKSDTVAMRAAEVLGLTPMGRLKIAKDAGFAQHFNQERIGTLVDQGAALRAAAG